MLEQTTYGSVLLSEAWRNQLPVSKPAYQKYHRDKDEKSGFIDKQFHSSQLKQLDRECSHWPHRRFQVQEIFVSSGRLGKYEGFALAKPSYSCSVRIRRALGGKSGQGALVALPVSLPPYLSACGSLYFRTHDPL